MCDQSKHWTFCSVYTRDGVFIHGIGLQCHFNRNGCHELDMYLQFAIYQRYWWYVNIDSGNGLVPSDNKPLPDPNLTQSYVAKWRHLASMS